MNGGRPECRWVSITGYPRFDGDGTFVGYRGIARNVTSDAIAVQELETTHIRMARDAEREKVVEGIAGRRIARRAHDGRAQRDEGRLLLL